MTPLPRPDRVGGRAATTGSSSHHLNGSNRMPNTPSPDDHAYILVGMAACAISGFIIGLVLGLMLG
jgi:hypothetical protein